MKRWIVLAGALLAAGAAVAWYVRRDAAREEPPYRTEVVDRGDVTMTVTATGTLSAVTTVQVGSQVSGIIARLHADFNSQVERGQLLAELDPTPFEARVAERRAELARVRVEERRSQLDYQRQERLLADELASRAEYDAASATLDAARAQVELAQAGLSQAETDLRYTRIASPIDGVVVARQYDVGQTVAASFQAPTLFTIAQDLTKMQVQADVDQSDIGRVAVGQPVRFTVDAYPEQPFQGTISQIRLNATVNQNVITYPVIVAVANPDQKLRPQMTADVTIDVAQVHDVLRVPNAALRFRPTSGASAGSDQRPGAQAAERGSRGGTSGAGANGRAGGFEEGTARLGHRGGAGGAGALLGATRGAGSEAGQQAVYVLASSGQLERVSIRTGITDGRYTQVVGGDLEPGAAVVVGQATVRVEGAPPMGGGPGMRGGRFF